MEVERLAAVLQARSPNSEDLGMVDKLLEMLYDQAKAKLVDADGIELSRLQGEARAYKAIARLMHRNVVIPMKKDQ